MWPKKVFYPHKKILLSLWMKLMQLFDKKVENLEVGTFFIKLKKYCQNLSTRKKSTRKFLTQTRPWSLISNPSKAFIPPYPLSSPLSNWVFPWESRERERERNWENLYTVDHHKRNNNQQTHDQLTHESLAQTKQWYQIVTPK